MSDTVQPPLDLRGVSYRYPAVGHEALIGVDLAVQPGEVVGITGRNESGKSTLCLVAAGLAPGSIGGELSGDVRVDGVSLAGLRQWQVAERVGIVFGEPASQLSGVTDTVFEEVALGPVNLGLAAVDSAARAVAALGQLGIPELAARHPQRLSGGQQQLVAIASMIAMAPRVLVLDEPLAELDPDGRRRVSEILQSISRAGTAILVAEHDTDTLDSICHRVLTLHRGRLQ
jgi:energy-coupling factor transport system ATP-binding protein